MYLVDANVFLEIVLSQDKQVACKHFLDQADVALFVSDFALHSIGVILFRNDLEDSFQTFLEELLPRATVLSLPETSYWELKAIKAKWGLDFDDAYQYAIAKEFGLQLVTMDEHFKAVKKDIEVVLI